LAVDEVRVGADNAPDYGRGILVQTSVSYDDERELVKGEESTPGLGRCGVKDGIGIFGQALNCLLLLLKFSAASE
jgi:hypothetical protein